MRMKAMIVNPVPFARVAQSIEKHTKSCFLKLTPERIHLIALSDNDTDTQIWSHMNTSSIFENYIIESACNNEIYIDLQVEHLSRALKSACSANAVLLKLTKSNNCPVLLIHTEELSDNGTGNRVQQLYHRIPIGILTSQQMEQVREPICPRPQVYIMMPNLSSIRSIAERMKALAGFIVISANLNGEFTLRVQTDLVHVETFYKGLIIPELDASQADSMDSMEVESSEPRDKSAMASARVDVKSFVKFLYSHHVAPQNVVCCIIEKHALVFYVYLGPNESIDSQQKEDEMGVLTFYLPVHFD